MAKFKDFLISYADVGVALNIPSRELDGKNIPHRISGGNKKSAWATDVVRAMRLKNPRQALVKMSLHMACK